MVANLPKRPDGRREFLIAIICALTIEADMVEALLDKDWADDGIRYGKAEGDLNTYTTGVLAGNNVVIAHCHTKGSNSAAQVATGLRSSFKEIKIAFVVGICGVVPFTKQSKEIIMGDCIISTALIQFDLGRRGPAGFEIEDGLSGLGRYGIEIGSLLAKLKGRKSGLRLMNNLASHLKTIQQEDPERTKYPGINKDRLFRPDYRHGHRLANEICPDCVLPAGICDKTCKELGCEDIYLVSRTRLSTDSILPNIHFGYFGSSNTVLMSGSQRDELAKVHEIVAFEMEGSGVWDVYPTVVIKSACDYADSHKNKIWQSYAAAVAAAGTKAFLQELDFAGQEESSLPKDIKEQTEPLQGEDYNCLRDLRITDPRDDRTRIEAAKGGLLKDAYQWINDNETFKSWKTDPMCRVLWITGDAGKGKTMLLCGTINELNSTNIPNVYFFFQATDVRLNTGVAALRGLMFSMIRQTPRLIDFLREDYDIAKSMLFEDINAWFALSRIFVKMLASPLLKETIIVLDALDECEKNRDELLQLIVASTEASSTKWIISSRNWPVIEKQLEFMSRGSRLSLELNEKSVAAAVTAYILYKVEQLDKRHRYSLVTKILVTDYLQKHADNTFLWVALACQYLMRIKEWRAYDALKDLPPGIDKLYQRMMDILLESEDADLLTKILATVSIVLRPLTMQELIRIAKLPEQLLDRSRGLHELVYECGSFLIYRSETIQFVHASAQEYVSLNDQRLFPNGKNEIHLRIFRESTATISSTLSYNIFNAAHVGSDIDEIQVPAIDPLQNVRYSCVYFLDHFVLASGNSSPEACQLLHKFLTSRWFQWLEAISLIRNSAKVMQSITELRSQTFIRDVSQDIGYDSQLQQLVSDAYRFVTTFSYIIERYPLQVYFSGPLFSPTIALTKQPSVEALQSARVCSQDTLSTKWSSRLQSLEGHSNAINKIRFSPDGSIIATGSDDTTVKLWSSDSGTLRCTLSGHESQVKDVRFSPNGQILAANVNSSSEHEIWIWHVPSAILLRKFKMRNLCDRFDLNQLPTPFAFFPCGNRLISAVGRIGTIYFWHLSAIDPSSIHETRYEYPKEVCVSHGGGLIAIVFAEDCCVVYDGQAVELVQKLSILQDVRTGKPLLKTPNETTSLNEKNIFTYSNFSFSSNDRYIVFENRSTLLEGGKAVYWLDLITSKFSKQHFFNRNGLHHIENMSNANHISMYSSKLPYLQIVDLETGDLVKRFLLETRMLQQIKHSPAEPNLICVVDFVPAFPAKEASLWELDELSGEAKKTSQNINPPTQISFFPCGTKVLIYSTIWVRVYDVYGSGESFETVYEDEVLRVSSFALSYSQMAISFSDRETEDTTTYYLGSNFEKTDLNIKDCISLAFSPSGELLLVGLHSGEILVFQTIRDPLLVESFQAHDQDVLEIQFQSDGSTFISQGINNDSTLDIRQIVKHWSTDSRDLIRTLHIEATMQVAFSPNGLQIACISAGATFEIDYAVKIEIHDLVTRSSKVLTVTHDGVYKVEYDATSTYLRSTRAMWKVNNSLSGEAKVEASNFLTVRGRWIYEGERKVLWLAPEYGKPAAVHKRVVALWHDSSGKVLFLDISHESRQDN